MDRAIDEKEPVVWLPTGKQYTCRYMGDGNYHLDNTIVVKREEIENISVYQRHKRKQMEPSEHERRMSTLEASVEEIKKTLVLLTERLEQSRKRLHEIDEEEERAHKKRAHKRRLDTTEEH